jgi:transcriptional regulator with XRE-family HTH domain
MKSIRRAEYRIYCDILRELREDAGLRQSDLAKALGVRQAYVSAYEMGKTRLDFVQIRDWCRACNTTLAHLVALFEDAWALPEPERLARVQQAERAAPTPDRPEPAAATLVVEPAAAASVDKSGATRAPAGKAGPSTRKPLPAPARPATTPLAPDPTSSVAGSEPAARGPRPDGTGRKGPAETSESAPTQPVAPKKTAKKPAPPRPPLTAEQEREAARKRRRFVR